MSRVSTAPVAKSAPVKANGDSPLVTKEVALHWSEIHWFDSENTRVGASWGNVFSDFSEATRPLKDEETEDSRRPTPDGLVLRLLNGWETLKQAYVEVTVPTAEEVKRAHAERRGRLDSWAASDIDLLKQLAIFVEPIWFPGGKSCEIKAIGNMAYRRGRSLPGVAYARQLRSIRGEYRLPCLFVEYATKKAKFLAHIGENFGKDAGRSRYSALDEATLAVRFAELPDCKEADLVREGMKRGAAQKAWRFAQLNRQHRSLRLAERIGLTPKMEDGRYVYETGGYVPYKSLDKEELIRLLNGREPFAKDGKKVNVTIKFLESYLQQVMAGGNRERMLGQGDLKFLMGMKTNVIAFVAQAIKEGNKDALIALDERFADKLNAAADLIALKEEVFAVSEEDEEDKESK